MSKYIEYFDEHVDYEEFKLSQDYVKPNVSYCKNEEEIHYEDEEETRVACKYNITDIEEPTVLGLQFENFSKMYVDDVEVTKATSYLFSTTGIHIIKFIPLSTILYLNCFRSSIALEEVWIPDSIKTLSGGSFYGCSGLKRIRIPETLTTLGELSFFGCTLLLLLIRIPNVTKVPASCFRNSGITSVVLGNATTIEDHGFRGCTKLKDAVLGTKLLYIKTYVFYGCSNLRKLNLPNTLKDCQNYAFCGCTKLLGIDIPSSLTSLNESTFNGCLSITHAKIPEGVTTIKYNLFYNCISLTSLILPSTLKSFEGNSVRNTGITSIIIPNGVTSIGSATFSGTSKLKEIEIPDSVKTFGTDVFNTSGLTSIKIGSGLTNLNNSTFRFCASLKTITITAITPPTAGNLTFLGTSSLLNIYVPAESVEAYKTASYWSSYASKIQAIT